MSKQWDQNIHDRLKDFRQKAPEGLLDDIKSEMSRRNLTAPPVSNTSKHIYPILRVAAVAAMLLILLGLSHLWIIYTEKAYVRPITTELHHTIYEPTDTHPNTKHENKAVPTTASLSPALPNVTTSLQDSTYTIKEDTLSTTEESLPQKQLEKATSPTAQTRKEVCQQEFFAYSPKHHVSSMAVGIFYSGTIGHSNLSQTSTITTMQSPNFLSNIPGHVLQSHTELKEKEQHHIPVRWGLSIRYNINERWSLQSGLTYSYLVSDLSKSNQQISFQTKQKLHYVGIPLQIGYQLWSSKHFKGYITAGAQIEKLVKGEASTDYSVNDKHQSSSNRDIKDKKLLFSALTSIGAEYSLSKDFSLYVEPGLHYYFKNNNGLTTHYNEQPFNFNLSIGLRLHWNK